MIAYIRDVLLLCGIFACFYVTESTENAFYADKYQKRNFL